MFSYRHAFHAGNHADVLKHMVLVQLLRHMALKEAACMTIDTHAGAGLYALDGNQASKSGEFKEGIARLWQRQDLPAMVADYVGLIKKMNPDGKLRHYPGSPYCAYQLSREQDRLRLFELHPSDIKLLNENFQHLAQQVPPKSRAGRGKRVMVQREDGFASLRALLPPPSRRGLILIDPPYEDKNDYRHVVTAVADALTRFPTGTYAVWYPLLPRPELRQMLSRLKRLPETEWLHVSLRVGKPSPDGLGLRGSGMYIINPPWTLAAQLKESMPWLTQALAQDEGAEFSLETGTTPASRGERD